MKNNNGKIAIAIVAMFVVALSVVGFTYAYFTAQVVGNDKEESVKVTAGELVIDYQLNKTIAATNVVPKWASDGDMYYDPVKSVTLDGNINKIVAVSYDEFAGAGLPEGAETSDYGLTEPAMFTVQNTGTDTAWYQIELRDITNGIVANNAADANYVRVELWSSNENIAYDAAEGWTKIYDEPLALTGETQVIAQAASITADPTVDADNTRDGQTVYYKLVLRYNDSGVKQNVPATGQDTYKSQTLKASVFVRGLGQNNQSTTTTTTTSTQATEPVGP